MKNYKYIKINENIELADRASSWFCEKWDVPKELFFESMIESQTNQIPKWYVVMDDDKIVGGLGVISNDFHNREDLAPNISAVYVEEEYRNQGIASKMLKLVSDDVFDMGFDSVYLITKHDSYYERYGFEFIGMVEKTNGPGTKRMYELKNKINI